MRPRRGTGRALALSGALLLAGSAAVASPPHGAITVRGRATAVALSPAAVSVAADPVTGPSGGAQVVLGTMSEAQRIGQLFMVGGAATGVSAATLASISSYHVGNVILTGRSSAGAGATRTVTNGLQARASIAATAGVPLFVATDQEGGQVQVLSGPGFSTIPEALTQGTWSTTTLQASAHAWGNQLAAAGVNVNLAPVMDTVPVGQFNPPIGGFDREYGHTTAVVGPHGTAFALGMAQARVAATVKHFPGLGRVTANTDDTSGVTDYVTTFDDPFLAPFRQAIAAGAPFAMMSTAYYHLIDPTHPAAFSSKIIGGMLRGELGFHGVVISDDLGAAAQVAGFSPGARAVDFINAGGDIVLTVTPSVIPAMIAAVTAAAASSSAFRAKVDAAALQVLAAKQQQGLLPSAAVAADFTGSGRADLAVFRPASGTWYIRGTSPVRWGQGGDIPVPANYAGGRAASIAVFRPANGTWYIRGMAPVRFGQAGDVPVPGDYDGTGRAQIAVFRPSTSIWYVYGSTPVRFGEPGEVPVPADYTGTGRMQIAVWRPSNGTWYVRGLAAVRWGEPGDVPVPRNYTGAGHADLAVWRPSTGVWYVRGLVAVRWGVPGEVPVPASFTGTPAAQLTVWRPATGTWFVRGVEEAAWGLPGDDPV